MDGETAGEVSAEDAADAVLAGAATISAGAFADVSVQGRIPGEIASVPTGAVSLSLRVEALPQVDVTTMYVLANCDLAATVAATAPTEVLKFSGPVEVSLSEDAHLVVLGFGESPMPRGLGGYDARDVPRFVTNPIYVDVDGDGAFTPPGAKGCATGVEVGR